MACQCHTVPDLLLDVITVMSGFMVVVLELVNKKHHALVLTCVQLALQSTTKLHSTYTLLHFVLDL